MLAKGDLHLAALSLLISFAALLLRVRSKEGEHLPVLLIGVVVTLGSCYTMAGGRLRQ
jgi:hypothetical protein